MENSNFTPSEFNDEVFMLIYGENANISELRKTKQYSDVLNDVTHYLAKDDITKIEEIRKLPLSKVFDFLESKVKTIKANNIKPKIEPVGFKLNGENDKLV